MQWILGLLGQLLFHKRYLTFGLAILFSLTLLSLDKKKKIEASEAISEAIFSGAQKCLWWTIRLRDLERENRRLRAEITNIALENALLQEAGIENERLRKLLGFKTKKKFQLIPAEVIGVNPSRIVNSILINVGKDRGIEINMPVVTDQGLVGKVIDVFPRTALVQLLLDRNCRVSAIVQRSRVIGIVEWAGGSTCRLKNVLDTSDVQVGDVLISSGMGGVFPKGLKIGVVSRVTQPKGRIFKEVKVVPSVNFTCLEEVFILSPKSPPADRGS